MVVGAGRQETLNPGFVLLGTRQQGILVILRKLVLLANSIPRHPASHSETLPLSCLGFLSITSNHHLIIIYSARSVKSSRLVATFQHGR
ncbi:unnamed protein product [Schistosoma margrebowiei]|uniref:Uncharacterized protein n=1 Tax=Schistosoma margrebowiei TaxID=48269 RepID=A0A183L8T0_9TREM|nr:unnamed protein product [Schistosoma margrebowiei]